MQPNMNRVGLLLVLLSSLATLTLGSGNSVAPLKDVYLGAVIAGCGGIINITRGDTFYVAYKYETNETLSDNENCVWTFLDEKDFSNSNLLVQFEFMHQGFIDSEQLFVTTYNGYNSLVTTPVRQKELYDFLGSGMFLTLQTTRGGGTGFMVKIETSLFLGHNRITRVFDRFPGKTSYGPYKESDRVVVVVNPPKNLPIPYIFQVESLNTEFSLDCSNDGMEIYELQPRAVWPSELWRLKYRLCSNGAVSTPLTIKAEYPILALFWTDLIESGGDFRLSWQLQ